MRRQRFMVPGWRRLYRLYGRGGIRDRDAQCATPFIEDIQDVGLAELDAHRAPTRPLRVVPIEIAIDAPHRDGQRHALRRPATHLFERRPDDANEVTVVLAAEIGLDLATVVF